MSETSSSVGEFHEAEEEEEDEEVPGAFKREVMSSEDDDDDASEDGIPIQQQDTGGGGGGVMEQEEEEDLNPRPPSPSPAADAAAAAAEAVEEAEQSDSTQATNTRRKPRPVFRRRRRRQHNSSASGNEAESDDSSVGGGFAPSRHKKRQLKRRRKTRGNPARARVMSRESSDDDLDGNNIRGVGIVEALNLQPIDRLRLDGDAEQNYFVEFIQTMAGFLHVDQRDLITKTRRSTTDVEEVLRPDGSVQFRPTQYFALKPRLIAGISAVQANMWKMVKPEHKGEGRIFENAIDLFNKATQDDTWRYSVAKAAAYYVRAHDANVSRYASLYMLQQSNAEEQRLLFELSYVVKQMGSLRADLNVVLFGG